MPFPSIFPVTCHTKFVGPGSLFVALEGARFDGVAFISEALTKGAREIAVEKGRIPHFMPQCLCGVTQEPYSQESNWECVSCGVVYHFPLSGRRFLAEVSAKRLGYPSRQLTIVGVTGTKGKTTTTFIAEHMAKEAGKKTALLGTVMARIGDEQCDAEMTTPTADQLQMFFALCVKAKVDVVFMEVSSHALTLDRVHGVIFDVVGFTNFGSDHLDFHVTVEAYFAAKLKVFDHLASHGVAVVNAHITQAGVIAQNKGLKTCTFGSLAADYHYAVTQNSFEGLGFSLFKKDEVVEEFFVDALFGAYNAENVVMALLLNHALGISFVDLKKGLQNFTGVPGRLQKHILKNGSCGFVDYAHNAIAVEAVLKELRPLTQDLIVIFGCGGNRDPLRRPTMGAAAARYADTIIVTDDNPRFEESDAIIADILKGIPHEKMRSVICESNRSKAIELAAQKSIKGSVIALLGKGHERYFLIKGEKFVFDDFKELSQY